MNLPQSRRACRGKVPGRIRGLSIVKPVRDLIISHGLYHSAYFCERRKEKLRRFRGAAIDFPATGCMTLANLFSPLAGAGLELVYDLKEVAVPAQVVC